MELIDIEEERRLSREDAAAWLRTLADSLARHNDLEFVREGIRYRVAVPAEVVMQVELEIEEGEIEISW